MLVKDHYSYNKKELIIMTYLILRDYYMTFPISALVSHSPRRPYQARQRRFAVGLDMGVSGWYQGRYGKFHIIIYLSHILHWLFSSIDFYIGEKNLWTDELRKKLTLANIFVSRVWFQKDIKHLYNDVIKCL
jgi:hypothetical protein